MVLREGKDLWDYGILVLAKLVDNMDNLPPQLSLELDIVLSKIDILLMTKEIEKFNVMEKKTT